MPDGARPEQNPKESTSRDSGILAAVNDVEQLVHERSDRPEEGDEPNVGIGTHRNALSRLEEMKLFRIPDWAQNEWKLSCWFWSGGFFSLGTAGLIIFAVRGGYAPIDYGMLVILEAIAVFLFVAGILLAKVMGPS